MARGIDQQVTALADAYRNNPAALQKNYKVNQNLLDLLALQKLKTETEAAKREIEMSQQPESQTVAQQRADEAVGRSKNEIVEQVGGIAQLQKGRQQQNLQRMAAGAPPANQPAQMAGIANQPAPNMARMAKGGIVSFAGPEGSEVKSPTPEELLREAGFQGNIQEFYNLPKEKQQRVLATINDRRAFRRPDLLDRGMAYAGDVISSPVRGAVDALGPLFRQFGILSPTQKAIGEDDQWAFTRMTEARRAAHPDVTMAQLFPGSSDPSVDQTRPPGTSSPVNPAVGPTAGPPVNELAPPVDSTFGTKEPVLQIGEPGTASLLGVDTTFNKSAEDPDLKTKFGNVRTGVESALDTTETRMGADYKADRLAAQGEADTFQDRTGIKTAYDDMYRDKQALADRQAADRKANLWRTLGAGAGGEGAFANIARTATNERAAEQLREQRALGGLQDLRIGQLATDERIAQQSLTAGQEAGKLSAQDITNATTAHANLLDTMKGTINEEARLALDRDELNMNADIEAARIEYQKQLGALNASTRVIVAEHTGKIAARGQDIQKLAVEQGTRDNLQKAVESTTAQIAALELGVTEAITDRIKADVAALGLEGVERDNYIKEETTKIRQAIAADLRHANHMRDYFTRMLKGAYLTETAPRPNTKDYSNPKQTSKG
jgi:hypothetical protein